MGIKKIFSRLIKAIKSSNSEKKDNNYIKLSQDNSVDDKVTAQSILSNLEDNSFWTSNIIGIPKGLLEQFLDQNMLSLIDGASGDFCHEDACNSYLLGASDTG